jgi:hypothetical protein
LNRLPQPGQATGIGIAKLESGRIQTAGGIMGKVQRSVQSPVFAVSRQHHTADGAIARLLLPFAILWAAPWTAAGLGIGLLAVATGGGVQRVGRVVEFHGGLLSWLLTRAPIAGGASAMTLGHSVLARTAADLDRTRQHELVHVAQYERWGLLFVPVYLGCSAWLWLRGRNPYWDNPFEREAYGNEIGPAQDV